MVGGRCVFILALWAGAAVAQQDQLTREGIPADMAPRVREQVLRLFSPTALERLEALAQLSRIPDRQVLSAAPYLVMLLGDTEEVDGRVPYSRATSCSELAGEILADIGAGALDHLLPAAKHPDAIVRQRALEALEEVRDPRVVDAARRALRDPEGSVRRAAMSALAYQGGPELADTLFGFVQDEDVVLRREAIGALVRLRDPRVYALLEAQLLDKNAQTRAAAFRHVGTLGLAGNPDLLALVVSALRDDNVRVRVAAAQTLGGAKTALVVEPLVAALANPDPSVRRAVVQALHKIGDPRAVGPLLGMLEDSDRMVRHYALTGLAEPPLGPLTDPSLAEPLLKAAREGTKYNQAVVLRALARIEDARAMVAILLGTGDRTSDVRAAALRALGDRGTDQARTALISVVNPVDAHTRRTAIEQLARFEGREALNALRIAARDADPYIRMAALEALGGQKDRLAFTTLVNATKDPEVRESAFRGLAKQESEEAAKKLLELAREHGDRGVRDLAFRALGTMNHPLALEAVLAGLQEDDPLRRREAIRALAKRKEQRAIPGLIALLGHESLGPAAARALRTITGQNFGQDAAAWKRWHESAK